MSDLYGYVATGNAWPYPERITISFIPDGTDLGGPKSNLFSYFCQRGISPSTWQAVIAKAAQLWSEQTNINFSVVYDNGAGLGAFLAGPYQQGSPYVGDIRIGGYDFQNPTALATAVMPPPDTNYNLAGDIRLNTGVNWYINGQANYDLFSVVLHEIGHALGLGHSSTAQAVMAPTYVFIGLHSDDIAGIRSIYSSGNPRSADSYESNETFGTATDLTGLIDFYLRTPYLDITSSSDLDYLKVVAPSGGTGTMVVKAQSDGLSFLALDLKVYDSGQTQLATNSTSGNFGGIATCSVSVTAGQTYYIRVASAGSSPFNNGRYAVTVQFGTNAPGSVPPPDTLVERGDPIQAGGGQAFAGYKWHKHRPEIVNDKGKTVGYIHLAREPHDPKDWIIPALPDVQLQE